MDHSHFAADAHPTTQKPATVPLALLAASRALDRLVQRRARRMASRAARQEIEALSSEILKDIGLRRGRIGELSLEVADRLRQRP